MKIETTIGGTTDPHRIEQAAAAFLDGVANALFPEGMEKSKALPGGIRQLQSGFLGQIEEAGPVIADILGEINERAELLRSPAYKALVERDRAQWLPEGVPQLPFGVSACVDRGIPSEAVAGLHGHIGRTLAGDVEISPIESKGNFAASPSPLKKRLIHQGRVAARQGETDKSVLIESLVEHLGCGRRGQMLANDEADHGDVPRLSDIIDRVDLLKDQFQGDLGETNEGLAAIKAIWERLERSGVAVKTMDGGAWAGVVAKVAQRQALEHIPGVQVIAPIQIYDKTTGNVLAGVDRLSVLTDRIVQSEGGLTPKAIEGLEREQKIFSLRYSYKGAAELFGQLPIERGRRSFSDLQEGWLEVQSEFVDTTSSLWEMYRSKDAKYKPLQDLVHHYLTASLGQLQEKIDATGQEEQIRQQLTHQLFRELAYAHVLNTFEEGHAPGLHHLEDHLATRDHSIGAKRHLALGQGDLQAPSVGEMFTGRSVLLHSTPGEEGTTIPLMLKLDTDRSDNDPMSTEETNIALNDLGEALKLWPYMVAGDVVPVIAVRSKVHGGVSRLPVSIVQAMGDLVDLSEQGKSVLPDLVPANTSKGEVVSVPAEAVIRTAIATGGDLKRFRKAMDEVGNQFADPSTQRHFQRGK